MEVWKGGGMEGYVRAAKASSKAARRVCCVSYQRTYAVVTHECHLVARLRLVTLLLGALPRPHASNHDNRDQVRSSYTSHLDLNHH